MRRRAFIAGLGSAAAWPFVAHAKTSVVGMLTTSSSGVVDAGFQQGLADFGYVPGQNISLIRKEADFDRLDQLAAELISISPDGIFGTGSQATIALKRQTSTIPIVTMNTGVSLLGPEVAGKRLELLKELIPGVDTAAVLWNPDDPGAHFSFLETQAAGKAVGINLQSLETSTIADLDSAFSAMKKEPVQAVVLLPAPFMGRSAGRIAELALMNRLPTFGFGKAEAQAGELLSFGPDLAATARRAAYFVDRILKGTSPSELPVEQPTKFDLVINLKTAKALGLEVPSSLLARADEVIE